ncbi:MAG TPA: hypothetical protein VGZ32_15945 [Actinocrinis sp.]|jgi:hypothetical protein|uniref:hypothetical protein n=1 Tax=Actinocrinis sp. TaxID=1920516 RepID=UPI002DDD91A2|nr:hypothetical protein [Actinocrinis sp.]HEV3171843.1 hypothetical protein [Actinocrinis sp.]
MVTPAASPRKAVTVLSALALLQRLSDPGFVDLGSGRLEDFVHRDYAALFGAIPAIALGSLAVFALRDSAAGDRAVGAADGSGAATFSSLRPEQELALVGVLLAVMADRLEHDPVAYPLLACAAARLVAARPVGAVLTGLTERARRAAVEVLRPAALTTLLRAATWGIAMELERL